MGETPIRILCVDDHTVLVEGLRARIALESDLQFAGWLKSAEGLLAEIQRTQPHIVLLDIEMPGPDPFEVLGDIHRQYPHVRTIIFSAYVRDHYIDAAFKAGAWGYVSKSDEPAQLIDVIRKVAGGAFVFGSKVLERVQPPTTAGTTAPKPASKLDHLTRRELQILRLIGKGLSRTEIAETLHRSPKTVDNHRAAIMEKLAVRDRADLVRFAISEGLVEL